jgi:hypothetical protein
VGNCYSIRVNILFIQDDDAHLMFASSKFKLHDKLPNSLGFIAQFETSRSEESMKLRRNQYCPIHRSLSCCGREPVQKGRGARRLGVKNLPVQQRCEYSTVLRLSEEPEQSEYRIE